MNAREVRNEELEHKRHTLRKELSSYLWRLISCGSQNPVQQFGPLKIPQSHFISVPQFPTILLHLGIIVSSPVTVFTAVLHLRCTALQPPHLLKHELNYWGSAPFQGLEVLEMTRTDFPMGAAWRSSDTFPTFIVCVWVSLIWNEWGTGTTAEIVKSATTEVKRSIPWYCLLLLHSCWPPVMWQPSTSVQWHSSAQFLCRLLCTRLLCLSRNPGCQQCINAHSPEPEVETHRCNAFYSLLSEKCNLLTSTIHC